MLTSQKGLKCSVWLLVVCRLFVFNLACNLWGIRSLQNYHSCLIQTHSQFSLELNVLQTFTSTIRRVGCCSTPVKFPAVIDFPAIWTSVCYLHLYLHRSGCLTCVSNMEGGGSSKFDGGGLKSKHGGSLKCHRKITVKEFIWY